MQPCQPPGPKAGWALADPAAAGLGGSDVGVGQIAQGQGGVLPGQRGQRHECLAQPGHQIAGRLPTVLADAAHGALATCSTLDGVAGGPLQCRIDAVEPATEIGGAEGGDLERTCGAARVADGKAKPGQGMLEQRHQRGRREAGCGGLDRQIKERAGNRLAKRAAGGVVDTDAPGVEANGDTAREQAIR